MNLQPPKTFVEKVKFLAMATVLTYGIATVACFFYADQLFWRQRD